MTNTILQLGHLGHSGHLNLKYDNIKVIKIWVIKIKKFQGQLSF